MSGELPTGAKLPSSAAMAEDFGVAAMTFRQVLLRLEEEGLLSLEQGRGTFVRATALPGVLVLDDDARNRALLSWQVASAGARPVEAADPGAALAALAGDPGLRVAMTDVRMPTPAAGLLFIQTVFQRYPEMPVVAVTGYPADLDVLRGRPECPILVLTKPLLQEHVQRALHLVLGTTRRAAPTGPDARHGLGRRAALVGDDDPTVLATFSEMLDVLGFEVDAVGDGHAVREALARRAYSHAFVDLRMPGGGPGLPAELAAAYPETTVVVVSGHPGDLSSAAGGPFLVLPKPFDMDAVEAIVGHGTPQPTARRGYALHA